MNINELGHPFLELMAMTFQALFFDEEFLGEDVISKCFLYTSIYVCPSKLYVLFYFSSLSFCLSIKKINVYVIIIFKFYFLFPTFLTPTNKSYTQFTIFIIFIILYFNETIIMFTVRFIQILFNPLFQLNRAHLYQ